MARFQYPVPVLDEREEELIAKLTDEYLEFTKPGFFKKILSDAKGLIPESFNNKLKKLTKNISDSITETDMYKKIVDASGEYFTELNKLTSELTISEKEIVRKMVEAGNNFSKFNQICALRSYNIEKVIHKKKLYHLMLATVEGGITGAPGLIGVPFNIVLSLFLYFRTTQLIAMHYGYDVKNDPREMEFASKVTMGILSPSVDSKSDSVEAIIAKLMINSNLSMLRNALLKNATLEQLASKGGSYLFYVQVRAVASKAAEKALLKSGEKGLEFGVFRNLVESIAKSMTKKATTRAIPYISAVIGGIMDGYVMLKIVKGSNLIYHKRFLVEKETRVDKLKKARARKKSVSIEATDTIAVKP